MISNLQKYLNYGLIEADFNNLHIRKFIAETNHDFYEFISDPVNGYKISDKRYYTNNIYEKFVEEYPDYAPRSRRQISRKMFNFWLSRWGQFHFGADALLDRDAKGKYVEFKRK